MSPHNLSRRRSPFCWYITSFFGSHLSVYRQTDTQNFSNSQTDCFFFDSHLITCFMHSFNFIEPIPVYELRIAVTLPPTRLFCPAPFFDRCRFFDKTKMSKTWRAWCCSRFYDEWLEILLVFSNNCVTMLFCLIALLGLNFLEKYKKFVKKQIVI